MLIHLQFLLSFVLRHVADDDLLAWFQAADDLDVVVVALTEADLAGMEEVAAEDEEDGDDGLLHNLFVFILAKLCLLFGTHKEKAEKLQKGVLHDF